MAPAGRRPGTQTSSADILAAARRLFGERGYRDTTVRAIAAAAGVTPAMIHHFYGSKHQVFLAAIRMPLDPAEVLTHLLAGPRTEFPERLVRRFVAVWSDPGTGPAMRGVIRAAVSDEEHAAALRAFAGGVLIPRAAAALEVPPDHLAAAMSIMIGQAVGRSIIGIPQLAALSDEEVVERYVPAVRAALWPE
jgi:AcrR family transcriptional regulator